jgi:hypothetical protein
MGMLGEKKEDTCPFCKTAGLITQNQELAFRQWTSRGYVFCRVTVPIGVCVSCGSKSLSDAAESIIEDAVRREFERLPCARRALLPDAISSGGKRLFPEIVDEARTGWLCRQLSFLAR